jgi:hypothetical protein
MRSTIVLALLLTSVPDTFAQSPWSIGSRLHYGYLWPHRPSSWILVEGHALAYELFAEREVSGARQWHHEYLLPTYGIGVLYTDLANPERIGSAVRVLPYLHLPLVRGGCSDVGLRVGWGIGYVTKSYDRTDNTKQIAIGSQVNAAIQFMLEYRYRVRRTQLNAGLGVDHWSNGAYRMPNLGLNMLGINLGISYALGDVPAYEARPDTAPFRASGRTQSIVAAFGICESTLPLSGQYSAYSLNAQVEWQVSRKSGVAAGIDVFNKGTLVNIDADMVDEPRIMYTQFGAHGGYALLLGASSLYVQVGAYLYTPVEDEGPVYHRIGLRHRAGKHLLLNMSLKSHYAVADHWEIGAGYTW